MTLQEYKKLMELLGSVYSSDKALACELLINLLPISPVLLRLLMCKGFSSSSDVSLLGFNDLAKTWLKAQDDTGKEYDSRYKLPKLTDKEIEDLLIKSDNMKIELNEIS